jgi:hypothetical protein
LGQTGKVWHIDQPVVEETVWQKVLRFFKGLVWAGQRTAANEQFMPGEMPPDMQPVPSGPGGKG